MTEPTPSPPDPFETTAAQRSDFTRLLTGNRLKSYEAAAQANGSLDGLEIYSYNMALAAAFLGPLHILEVVARNSMHECLVGYTGRSDWWDSSKLVLVRRQADAVSAAEDKVDAQLRGKRPRTADDVVAALDFGFWCGLLGRGDARQGADYERDIWQPAVQRAFPRHRSNRGDLWDRFDAARQLRNRITHHEPIHTNDVSKKTNSIIRLVDLVSPEIATWVSRRTRLPFVAARPPWTADALRTF